MKNCLFVLTLFFGAMTTATYGQLPAESDVVDKATTNKIAEKLDEVAEKVDQNSAAQEARENILQPIYEAAEYLSFPAFHWIAFALMVAGVIGFALQLVLGKLFLLAQFHFSLMEILADSLGFVISAVGLILTTQAATENSNFTESPTLVLSASAIGLVLGLILYVRGQTQEFREARELRRKKSS